MPALILVSVAVLLAVLHVPLLLGKVPPNRFYGFRTPRLVADERAWYPANRIAGRNGLLMAAGLAFMAFTWGWLPVGLWVLGVLAAALGPVALTFYEASALVGKLDRAGPKLDLSRKDFSGQARTFDRGKLLDKLTRKE